jgi:hypothetical protein
MMWVMKLRDYLDSQKLKIAEAARDAGFGHETFRKWVKEERIPRPASMRKIEGWSKGEVTPADFFRAA